MQFTNCHNEDGDFGWGPANTTLAEKQKLSREIFDMVAPQVNMVDFKTGEPSTKKFMAWYASRKLFGKDILHGFQRSGACTGFSHGNLLNYLQCVEIVVKSDAEEFKYVYIPYHYGAGRMESYGKNCRKGEGAFGGGLAAAILKEGSISDEISGLPPVNKTATDWEVGAEVEIDWSGRNRDGSWNYEKYLTEGTKHTVKSAAKINSADDAAQAILNGYMVNICSNIGYRAVSSDGFNYPGPTWNHSLFCAGCDMEYNEPYFVIINSWSDVHGHLKDFVTNEPFPIGCLRIKYKYIDQMIRQGDSYAFSYYNGFPAQKLSRELFDLA